MKEDTNQLPETEVLAILRAADEIIGEGGRTLLTKILKGSREKKVLQLGLDTCPVYGYFKSVKLEEVKQKIVWMIDYDFLDIEYNGKLPMVIFTDRGWEIESDQLANEFLSEWDQWLSEKQPIPDMSYLKDRYRGVVFQFLDKVRETGDRKYLPYLEAWKEIDYKKVKAKIQGVIDDLRSNAVIDQGAIQERKAAIQKALKGAAPQDFSIKCWICGNRFTFTVGEHKFHKEMGFQEPRKCPTCREKQKYGELIFD